MRLVQHQNHLSKTGRLITAGEPLWKIAPTHDEDGTSLCDFMLLIPKLKTRQPDYIERAQSSMATILALYPEVVFANINMELNVLWVSHRYRLGLMLEIVAAIRRHVPEALLVAHNAHNPG